MAQAKAYRFPKKAGQARNQFGHNEADMVQKIIAFLAMNGFKVWRQDNTGKLDSEAAIEKLLKYFESIIIARDSRTLKAKEILALQSALWKRDIKSVIQGNYKSVTGGLRGISDIIGWHKDTGKFIGVEIKINDDKLSEYQISWSNELREAGGIFFVARTYEQFVDSFNNRFERNRQF